MPDPDINVTINPDGQPIDFTLDVSLVPGPQGPPGVPGTGEGGGTSDYNDLTNKPVLGTVAALNVPLPQSDVVDLETDLAALTTAEAADAAAITALGTRLDTDEGAIGVLGAATTTLAGRATTDEGLIAANSGAITALQNRATDDETAITALQTRATFDELAITGLQTSRSADEATLATATGAITTLQTRATADEVNITANATAVTALQGRATTDETAITALQTRATADEVTIAGNGTAITALQNRATTDETAITALQTSRTADEANIATAQTDITSLKASRTTDESNITVLQSLAFTTTKANGTMPAWPDSVNLQVGSSGFFFALNEFVKIPGIGQFQITAIPDSTHLTLQNLAMLGNVASGTSIPSGSVVLPIAGPVFAMGDFTAPVFEDFLTVETSAWTAGASGTLAAAVADGNGTVADALKAQGVLRLVSGTTTTGLASISGASLLREFTGFDVIWRVGVSAASNGTDTYRFALGFQDTAAGQIFISSSMIAFEHGGTNANWRVAMGAGSAPTYTDTGVAVVASTPYTLRMQMNQAWTKAYIYVNGTLTNTMTFTAASIAGQFATGGNRNTDNPVAQFTKSAGTTSVTAYIDSCWQRWITGR